jgi:hypothetical protein
MDRRGPVARRFRDLVHQVTSDLGGAQELTENQRQIVRRIASMSVWCESQEADMAAGLEVDMGKFTTVSNSLRRLCESIGLDRKAKPVQSVSDWIRAQAIDVDMEGGDVD